MQRFGHDGLGEMNETGEMFADLLCIKQIGYICKRSCLNTQKNSYGY